MLLHVTRTKELRDKVMILMSLIGMLHFYNRNNLVIIHDMGMI